MSPLLPGWILRLKDTKRRISSQGPGHQTTEAFPQLSALTSHPCFLQGESPWTKGRETRGPDSGRVTGTGEKRVRALGQEVSLPGVGHRPVPGALSAFRPRTATRALATSKLTPTNFRSRLRRGPAAQRSRERRATPSGRARDPGSRVPFPFIQSGSWGSSSAGTRPRRLSASPRAPGRLGAGMAVPGTKRRMSGTASRRASATPAHPLPHTPAAGEVSKRRGRRGAGLRSPRPPSPSPRTFRAPSQKRKFSARNFPKR